MKKGWTYTGLLAGAANVVIACWTQDWHAAMAWGTCCVLWVSKLVDRS